MKNKARLLKRMQAIPPAVRKRLRASLETSAQELTSLQRRLVPQSDGDLYRSIDYTFGNYTSENYNVRGVSTGGDGRGDPDLTVFVHAGDAKAFYAAWVEFGTAGPYEIGGKFAGATHPGSEAQPFFLPPYRALRRSIRARTSRAIRAGIKDELR